MRVVLILAAFLSTAQAQTVVQGRVTDAETGEGLAAATVQAAGTSRGTITNRAGDYEIRVPAGADSLVVRFIGYAPATRAVPASGRLDVALAPSVATLGEAVVTAGNPADNIMRRVIARKAQWQAGLQTWRAEAYSRQTFRADGEVVAVIEGQTTAYWDKGRGLREVVTGTRRTGNLGALPSEFFTAADQTINFYDDEIEFGGFDLMGPTNARAVGFYTFTLDGTRALGRQLVYDLSFRPSNPLQPGFTGTLAVLADADALLSVAVRPSDAVQFPLVSAFTLTMEQQFSSFGQSVGGQAVWLPADFRMDAQAKAGNALVRFPGIGFEVNSRLTDYAVNVAVPDSLYDRDGATVDSVAVAGGLAAAGVVPLSVEEERALAEIDSTRTLAQAFRPTGPLARFFNIGFSADTPARSGGGGVSVSYAPMLVYNRAEAVRLGGSVSLNARSGGGTVEAGYQTGPETVMGRVSAYARLAPEAFVGASVRRETVPLAESFYVRPVPNSLTALVAGEDYFDYARREGGGVWAYVGSREGLRPSARIDASYDDYTSAAVETRYTLFDRPMPAGNAVVSNRPLAAASLRLRLGGTPGGLAGSVTGSRSATVWLEAGSQPEARDQTVDGRPVLRESPSSYGRVQGEVRWSQPTVLRRRLLPPTLHLRLAAGTASDDLPLQRSFGIDGQLAGLAAFGALRARTGRLTLARQYALVAWEHDFRSVPFEALGWRGASPLGVSLQVHGAHAWADGAAGAFVERSVVHHEVGASLGLGYAVPVRLDVTYRLTDDPGVVFGVGLARLF